MSYCNEINCPKHPKLTVRLLQINFSTYQINPSFDIVFHVSLEEKGSHQTRHNNDCASGRNRAKFFNIPLVTKSAHIQLNRPSTDSNPITTDKTPSKPQAKSRSVSCQTVFREQSAQTKPYLPQIRYHLGVEKSELFQVNAALDIESSPGLDEIKAINRRRKRLECEKILKQYENSTDEQRHIFETLEWEEWLTRESDIENTQTLRFRKVEEMLKQRDKLFEIDSIKTIDHSVNRLNNEHKLKIENIKYVI